MDIKQIHVSPEAVLRFLRGEAQPAKVIRGFVPGDARVVDATLINETGNPTLVITVASEFFYEGGELVPVYETLTPPPPELATIEGAAFEEGKAFAITPEEAAYLEQVNGYMGDVIF